ncbi:cation-translocating P-type ATPase [Candidatus Bathyarchaeota archaeon]|nr:cation-translocating P-type ATPase [Candidatus Bathyarchaeota archaeon]
MKAENWHAMPVEEVLRALKTSPEGLRDEEAKKRLTQYGYNELKEEKRRTALHMFLKGFKDIFIILLLGATAISILIGYYEALEDPSLTFVETYADAIAIMVIVILVVVTGFVQEYRSEKAIEALRKLAAPGARVIRNGYEVKIPAREVVPGDIVLFEAGDRVPADGRLLEAVELRMDEAILTGESTPVMKGIDPVEPDAPISGRKSMVFMATYANYGRGKAVVTATGMGTEFGRIAKLVQEAEAEETPLQRKLDAFAKNIAKIVIIVCIVIFILEAFEQYMEWQAGRLHELGIKGMLDAFMVAVSLAVSAVPEGLPAIVTVTLALGAREFAKRNAIIRRLSSAETLGSTTIICSDKTGTLTKGEMTVRSLYLNDSFIEVTGVGYEPKGEFRKDGSNIDPKEDKGLELLLRIGLLCNNAGLHQESDKWRITGDPTEAALIVSAMKYGMNPKEVESLYKRIAEVPFTSERKRMTTIHEGPKGSRVAYMKGAPEVVLEHCSRIFRNGREVRLTEAHKKRVLEANDKMAEGALRVLGMAYRRLPKDLENFHDELVERDMVFVGLQGMIDPPREEAIEAYKLCQKAGVETVMITGDHKLTAIAVAKEIGLMKPDSLVLTGAELDKLSDDEFLAIVERVAVYARVSPEHKLRIVEALKKKGHIVAMTGDGVNDAPAIKRADIGIAMGITGTDVTREASAMVLADDNYATIVRAVERGRIIYDNIRKYARFLLACNFDELLVIGTFAVLGGIFGEEMFPLPLLAPMILWINLVTDGAPAIALSVDPPEEDVMDRPPRKPEEGILYGMISFVIASFILQFTGTVVTFGIEYWIQGHGLDKARTVAFMQAALFELFVVWNCRSEKHSVFRMKFWNNKFFVLADLASIALTMAIPYVPVFQMMFRTVPLLWDDWIVVLGTASWGFLVLPEIFMGRKVLRWK